MTYAVFYSSGNERSRESVRTVRGGFDNTRVKGAPRLAQEHAVGRVLHQGVLEQVARIMWDACRDSRPASNKAIEDRSQVVFIPLRCQLMAALSGHAPL